MWHHLLSITGRPQYQYLTLLYESFLRPQMYPVLLLLWFWLPHAQRLANVSSLFIHSCVLLPFVKVYITRRGYCSESGVVRSMTTRSFSKEAKPVSVSTCLVTTTSPVWRRFCWRLAVLRKVWAFDGHERHTRTGLAGSWLLRYQWHGIVGLAEDSACAKPDNLIF